MSGQLIPEEVWQMIEPLLPTRSPHPKGGRPLIADRDVMTGIIFMLKTGIAWEELPTEMGCGCGMTCLRRLREWQRGGIWPQIQHILETGLRDAQRMDWSRVRMRPAPRHSPDRPDLFGSGLASKIGSRLSEIGQPAVGNATSDAATGLTLSGQESF